MKGTYPSTISVNPGNSLNPTPEALTPKPQNLSPQPIQSL